MIYYISDLHLGHANIIKLCKRPFENVEEMNKAIISNWNSKVTNNDKLCLQKDKIENAIGRELIWDRKEGAKASSISYLIPDEIDIYNAEKYDEYAKAILEEINNHFYKISKFVK